VAFGLLTIAAATVQVFTVSSPHCQGCLSVAFVFAALIVLDYPLLALSLMLLFIPEWIISKKPALTQLFNIANFILSSVLAREAMLLVDRTIQSPWSGTAAIAAAIAVFTLVNHGLLAIALQLTKGLDIDDTRLFNGDGLLIDSGLAALGAVMAMVWKINAWYLVVAIYPLVLIYRSLELPNLRDAVVRDSKTGLFNSRYFNQVFEEEVRRAVRYGRPLSVIMADLDLLRDINNTYGHLAGDAVIIEVAQIITEQIRTCDIVARFGGEEFAILLPETDLVEAVAAAERFRTRIASQIFVAPTSGEQFHATMSFGVAACPNHGCYTEVLLNQADLAAHWSKTHGRNCVHAAGTQDRQVRPMGTLPTKYHKEEVEANSIAGDTSPAALSAPGSGLKRAAGE
jgi:diguanylate cyclase (GGDEF)-like protein